MLQVEEICLGQETQGKDIRPVEICALVWWVQNWDLWFHPPCLCATRKRWTDGLYMHGSHREAWRRRCDGVGLLCWWHGWGFIQNWRHAEPAWPPQHLAATCHPIRFAFSLTIIYYSTGQWPQTPGCVRAIWPRRRVMECCTRWPSLHSHLS